MAKSPAERTKAFISQSCDLSDLSVFVRHIDFTPASGRLDVALRQGSAVCFSFDATSSSLVIVPEANVPFAAAAAIGAVTTWLLMHKAAIREIKKFCDGLDLRHAIVRIAIPEK